ncbi:MAG: hypothetical protein AAE985_06215 [Thermoplasmataceae archaeon]|jgi:hypothetical protein
MRVIPVIVLLFLLISSYGVHHSVNKGISAESSTIIIGNQTIGGMGYNSTFYSAGNITTDADSSVIFLNTNIVFEAKSGISSFTINGNLTLVNSSILTYGSLLDFNDTSIHGTSLVINSSRLDFSGTFDVSGRNLGIMNSSFTHSYKYLPMKTTFSNDTGNITLSSLNVTDASSASFVDVYTMNQNGQPISITHTYEYSGTRLNPFIPFIDSEAIKINYTLGNVTGSIRISLGNGSSGYINRSIVMDGNSTCINLVYQDNHFSSLNSYPINGKVPVNITIPYGENITVWKSSIVFLSNDSLYLNGTSHNFIIFNNSTMNMVSDSLISNNQSRYSMNGIINPLKRGIILDGNSWVNFISTAFYAGNSGITPIISSENSSFFIYSEVLQRIKSNISYVVIANAEPSELASQVSTISVNITAMEGKANNLLHEVQNCFRTYSTALVEYKIMNSSVKSIADFILPYSDWNFYFSLNPDEMFSGHRYVENYSVNVSMVDVRINSRAYNNSLEVSAVINDLYENSNNLIMNLSFRMVSYSAYYKFKVSELSLNSMEWYNHTFTFPLIQNTTNGIIAWSLQYNNTLNIETGTGSQSITIPGAIHEFSLYAVNLSMSKGWLVFADGEPFHSSTNLMDIFLPVNTAKIYIPDQRMFYPVNRNLDEKPGLLNNITFSKIIANVSIEISGYPERNNSYLSIGNLVYVPDNRTLNFSLQMGNYSLSIYSGNSQIYTATIFIYKMNQTIVISLHKGAVANKPPTDILNKIYPIIAAVGVIICMAAFIRVRYLRMCPLCLSEVGFIHLRHRCPYKKS